MASLCCCRTACNSSANITAEDPTEKHARGMRTQTVCPVTSSNEVAIIKAETFAQAPCFDPTVSTAREVLQDVLQQ
eukprot:1229021-Amphidinium_carterae.1